MNEQSTAPSGITVSGGDVYMSGYTVDYINAKIYPMYWKNGVAVHFRAAHLRVCIPAPSLFQVTMSILQVMNNPASPNREIAIYWKTELQLISDTDCRDQRFSFRVTMCM